MNLKIRFIYLLLMLLSVNFYGQDAYMIKGTVTSEADGMPLPGVSVIILNTTKGVDTDFDGNFTLNAKKGDVLQFTYLGFTNKLVTLTGQNNIQVLLSEDNNVLDEVVVVGYGTQKKSHLTGSISQVSAESLEQVAVSRVDDALVGQVSGVNIQATDGQAGAAPTISIRGVGSMAGDSTPLIVVDGVIVDADFLGSLNMNDVESFEVLKDAASASVYGSKGSNGVIMISMKSGIEGKVKISYTGYTGLKTGRKSDAYGYTLNDWANKQLDETGSLIDYTTVQLDIAEAAGTLDKSWQDVFIGQGLINSHSLSLRGGSDKTKFAVSVNYSNDEGVLLLDNYRRYGARSKVDFKINDKFSAGINFSPTYTIRKRFSESIHNVVRQSPWLPIYHTEETLNFVDPDLGIEVGDYATARDFTFTDIAQEGVFTDKGDDVNGPYTLGSNWGNTGNQNAYARVVERDRSDKKFKLFSSVYGMYDITEDLNFKSSLAVTLQDTQRKDYKGTLADSNVEDAYLTAIDQGDQYYIFDNFFNYNKEIDKHELGVTLGNSIEQRDYFFQTVTGIGMPNDYVKELSNTTSASDADAFTWTKRGISYISRFNYAYDDKYLVNLSLRRDGSSIFGSDFKYGNFPAASIGWNLDNEDFLEGNSIVSKLKIRASYGVTGNDRLNTGSTDPDTNEGGTLSTGNILVDYYPHLDLVSSVSYIQDGESVAGYSPVNNGNPDLKWERLVEINPGIDFGLLRNRISGSIDWYQRTSDQLLLNNPVSVTTGFSNYLDNLGKVKNQGWEFELRTKNINNDKLKWNSSFIVTTNNNTLVDFDQSNGQITSIDPKRPAEWINLEGQPVSSFYGFVYDKEVPLEEFESDAASKFYRYPGQENGVVYVKDLNGDGVLDDEDKTILGNPYPELIWSITNEFSFGNVDFSFMFQGSHGAEVRNMADQYLFLHTAMLDVADSVDDEFIVEKIYTDEIIQDASYISLRNVSLGYNIPNDALDKIGVSRLRIYTTAQNLLYFTADDYTGWNPESVDKTSPTNYGYQRGGSPISSTVSLGVNIDF